MLYDNEEKTQSVGASTKPPVLAASTTPSAGSPTKQPAWTQSMGNASPAAVQVPATPADQREFVNSAIEFLHSGAEYYRAGAVVDESRLHRQLIGWKETLLGSLNIIHSSLNNDAALEQKLRQAYRDAVQAVIGAAASQWGRDPWDIFESNKEFIHEWAWMFATPSIIGMSSGLVAGSTSTPITAFFFAGETDERALIIGGVHGSELSGVEVAKDLVKSLKDRFDKTKKMPHFTTIIVPELFPDSVALAKKHPSTTKADSNIGREIVVPKTTGKGTKKIFPARQFPNPGQSLDDLIKAGGPTDKTGQRLKDAEGKPVPLLPETVALLKLIERFRPTRIASIHGHHFSDDPKQPFKVPGTFPAPKRGVDAPGIFVDPRGGFNKKTDVALTKEGKEDDALALAIAQEGKAGGARVPGNWLGSSKEVKHYANPEHPPGFSLGDWGPADVPGTGPGARKGMTVITVEVAYDFESSQDPGGARAKELQAHSDALMKKFLE